MQSKLVIVNLLLILFLSGCTSTPGNKLETKSFQKDGIGIEIEFDYPADWIVTDT